MRLSGSPRTILELTLLALASAEAQPTPQPTAPREEQVARATPTSPPTEATATPEELNQRWQAFIQKLKERSPVGGRNLEGSQLRIEGDTLYLYLRSEMARAYFRESPQREQRLVEMVRQQLRMPNAKVLLQVLPQSEAPPPPPTQPVLEGEALVEAVKRELNAYEIPPDM
jgi:hypothetical protein